jgi:hypothetical protein
MPLMLLDHVMQAFTVPWAQTQKHLMEQEMELLDLVQLEAIARLQPFPHNHALLEHSTTEHT